MIEVTQRYVDKASTIPMPRHYNVFIDGTYAGSAEPNTVAHLTGIDGDWLWTVPNVEMFTLASREAVNAAVGAFDASHIR